MENILTDGHCLLPNTVLPKNLDGLYFNDLAGKHQKHQNFPLSKFSAIRYIAMAIIVAIASDRRC